ARGRNPVHQAAPVRSGDQVALGIEVEDADVGFVGLEEDRAFAGLVYAENLAAVPSGDIKPTFGVKGHVPDVLGLGIKKDFRTELARARRGFGGACDPVHLAVRRRCGLYRARVILTQRDRLHLQLFGLEDHRSLAVGRDAVHPRRSSGGRVDHAVLIRGKAPDKGRRAGVYGLERRRQIQLPGAADGHTTRRPALKVLVAGLSPLPGAFGKGREAESQDERDKQSWGGFLHVDLFKTTARRCDAETGRRVRFSVVAPAVPDPMLFPAMTGVPCDLTFNSFICSIFPFLSAGSRQPRSGADSPRNKSLLGSPEARRWFDWPVWADW